MTVLCVAPIVEGAGDVAALPVLLRRLWENRWADVALDVLKPIPYKRTKLLRRPGTSPTPSIPDSDQLRRAITFAAGRIDEDYGTLDRTMILLLLDADRDCPKELAPTLARTLAEATSLQNISVVLAKVEFETWFVAAASSLSDYLRVELPADDIEDPEGRAFGKAWISERFLGAVVGSRYREPIDQPRLTAVMDLGLCRRRCPSFDKLCRELDDAYARATGNS